MIIDTQRNHPQYKTNTSSSIQDYICQKEEKLHRYPLKQSINVFSKPLRRENPSGERHDFASKYKSTDLDSSYDGTKRYDQGPMPNYPTFDTKRGQMGSYGWGVNKRNLYYN